MASKPIEDVLTSVSKDGIYVDLVLMKKERTKGRSRLVLTEEGAKYVAKLSAFGCTKEEIADEFGVSVNSLTNRTNKSLFDDAFKKGQGRFKTSIRVTQTKIMKRGSASMAIFLGKNYLGQSDAPVQVKEEVSPMEAFAKTFAQQENKLKKESDGDSTSEKP